MLGLLERSVHLRQIIFIGLLTPMASAGYSTQLMLPSADSSPQSVRERQRTEMLSVIRSDRVELSFDLRMSESQSRNVAPMCLKATLAELAANGAVESSQMAYELEDGLGGAELFVRSCQVVDEASRPATGLPDADLSIERMLESDDRGSLAGLVATGLALTSSIASIAW